MHEYFGLAIKNAWLDCGLTQEALAERAGISCRYWFSKDEVDHLCPHCIASGAAAEKYSFIYFQSGYIER